MFSTAHFSYVVPRAKRSLCEVFAELKLHLGDEVGTSDAFMAEMKGRTGEVDRMEFPEGDDAPPFLERMADACEVARTPYFAAVDAYHIDQRDGGKQRRALGFVLLNTTGAPEDRRRLTIPFEAGEVRQDLETLVSGGLAEDEAKAVLEQFDRLPHPGLVP